MHEIGLMQTALEAALNQAQTQGVTHINRVTLCVGEATGAMHEVLQMGFAALIQNTLAEGATLAIEPVPVLCFCSACQIEFTPARADDLYYECPQCNRFETQVRQGRDLYVCGLEVN